MTRLAVLDFGMGNLRSVAKALERAGAEVDVVPDIPPDADALVVPGQGAFGSCLANLGPERRAGIVDWIAGDRRYLGICLGYQILFEASDESPESRGLGVLSGKVIRFPGDLKVPHIGWNEVRRTRPAAIFDGIGDSTRFYFCHSYYPDAAEDAAATSSYGVEFACAAWRDNVAAVQFHPEKSGEPGIELLRNFVRRCGS